MIGDRIDVGNCTVIMTIRISQEEAASFEAEVTDIREVSRENGHSQWQIALSRTAFSAESSSGVLIATARSGVQLEVQVEAVEVDAAGEVWHTTHKPLLAGTQVRGRVTK